MVGGKSSHNVAHLVITFDHLRILTQPDGTVLRVCCASPKSEVEQKMVSWIHNSLASKILSWMQLEIDEDGSSATSLKLVNVQRYYEVDDSLKQKYAAGSKAVRPLFNRVFILKITRI